MQYGLLKDIWSNHQGDKCSYNLFIIRINKWLPFNEAIIKKPRWWIRYNKWRFDRFIEEYTQIYWEPNVSKKTLWRRINNLWRWIEDAMIRPLYSKQDTYYQ